MNFAHNTMFTYLVSVDLLYMLVAIPTIQLALWCPETRKVFYSGNTSTIHMTAQGILVLIAFPNNKDSGAGEPV